MGSVLHLPTSGGVFFDARIAIRACEVQLSRLALLAGLAIVGLTNPQGRADFTADALARRTGYSRPAMLKALRVVEARDLGSRATTELGRPVPVFFWHLERLPILAEPTEAPTVHASQLTPWATWQDVFSETYREHFARDTPSGRLSGVVPPGWPKEENREALREWSARRSVELGLDATRLVRLACEAFLSLDDKVDPALKPKGYPPSFMPRLIKEIDAAVVARLVKPPKSARVNKATAEALYAPRHVPGLDEIEAMQREAAALSPEEMAERRARRLGLIEQQ